MIAPLPLRPRDRDRPVIVGAGLAGLATALAMAPRPVVVLSALPLGLGTSTAWAQGGIAAAVGPDDAPALHLADTLAAGAGLSEPDASAAILGDGAETIERLARLGVRFDRDADGLPVLGLEAAHGRRRIVHADGDGTGAAVLRALVARARETPSIEIVEGADARHLLLDGEGRVRGLVADTRDARRVFRTDAVVIATGGVGGLFAHTTNPLGAVGAGIALAGEAGAVLRGMEFVQFHPTAIDVGLDPMPLATEAIRGEGAILIDARGERFVDELLPRDVVARAIAARIEGGGRVFLDARACLGARFPARFPSVTRLCRAAGIDPATAPIPVRPAAHYGMGGIETDRSGRTAVDGLWACGEAASTGLHGANRLASNSLLEAAAMGARVARDLAGRASPGRASVLRPPAPGPRGTADAIRPILSAAFGVVRDGRTMVDGAACLLALEHAPGTDAASLSVALAIAAGAIARRESRGAHARTDFPSLAPVADPGRTTLHAARASLACLAPRATLRRRA